MGKSLGETSRVLGLLLRINYITILTFKETFILQICAAEKDTSPEI